eukprot:scaffold9067_cov125-Chaetoceros_neogracile.AAC.2
MAPRDVALGSTHNPKHCGAVDSPASASSALNSCSRIFGQEPSHHHLCSTGEEEARVNGKENCMLHLCTVAISGNPDVLTEVKGKGLLLYSLVVY